MSNRFDRSVVVLAEGVACGIHGSREKLQGVLRTAGISNEALAAILATIGGVEFNRIVSE